MARTQSTYHCPPHIPYTDEEVIFAYKKLGTQSAVKEELGISQTTVYRILKRNGVPATGRKRNGTKKGYYGGGSPLKATDEQLIEDCKTLTVYEIAVKHGMHRMSLYRRFKRLGVYPIPKEPERKKKIAIPYNVWHFVLPHYKMLEGNQNFEYLESNGQKIRLRCKQCGAVLERTKNTIKRYNTVCEACEEKRKQQENLTQKRRDVVRVFATVKEIKTPKVCKECGTVFYSEYQNALYCSSKCKNKRKRKARNNSHRARCRKYGTIYDSSVTLEKVIKRDNNTCQICGKPCDPNDNEWGYSGPTYPTIDHIKALRNGGTHTWDNVQLAHAICNSYKRDLDDSEEIKEAVSNAKIQTA